MSAPLKALLTGGGTGGHVYPAVAMAEALIADGFETFFVGMRGGIEERILQKAGIPSAFISAAPLRRWRPLSIFGTLYRNLRGLGEAYAVVKHYRPDLVVATGGYVAFPVVLAARLASLTGRFPLFVGLVEPNAVPGLTNRLLMPLVDEVWGAFHEAMPYFGGKFRITGTPVRAAMRRPLDRSEAARSLGLDPNRSIILVIGGSQGARRLNSAVAMMNAAPLKDGRQVLHLCGKREEDGAIAAQAMAIARGDVRIIGYLDDPSVAYAASDVVVARSGASTIAELAATGKPSLLVPYPYATADHQRVNAEAVVATGAARIVLDQELDGDRLISELDRLLEPETFARVSAAAQATAMHDATKAILRCIYQSRGRIHQLRGGTDR
jgi:UDP-N-acetylglucosamine--N-acetylmuramyl-(pentapeptide) pyrophosphoryl-undecaprenol N-acetylglucosamine transferase